MVHARNHVIIDLDALAHNFAEVKGLVTPGTGIMGIVKSDAYGHGLVPVSRVLEKHGIDRLVSSIQEAGAEVSGHRSGGLDRKRRQALGLQALPDLQGCLDLRRRAGNIQHHNHKIVSKFGYLIEQCKPDLKTKCDQEAGEMQLHYLWRQDSPGNDSEFF